MSEVKKDEVVDLYNTYEEYLNIFITEDDMLYLAEEEVARLIVELGYRSSGTLSREKFFQTKAELSAARNINSKQDMESGEQEADNKETSQQDAETDDNQDVLLEVIKSRFSTNLDNTVNSQQGSIPHLPPQQLQQENQKSQPGRTPTPPPHRL